MPTRLETLLEELRKYSTDSSFTLDDRIDAMEKIGCLAFDTSDKLKVERSQSKTLSTNGVSASAA